MKNEKPISPQLIFYDPSDKSIFLGGPAREATQQIIGATSIQNDGYLITWHFTLHNGEVVEHSTTDEEYLEILLDLPPSAQLPALELVSNTVVDDLWNTSKERQVFEPRESDEPEPDQKLTASQVGVWSKTTLDTTLGERGASYGSYAEQSRVEKNIKDAMRDSLKWNLLSSDAQCALEMIATKISRLVTGDPDHFDSWHDIQGYARLVADRIQTNSEDNPQLTPTIAGAPILEV